MDDQDGLSTPRPASSLSGGTVSNHNSAMLSPTPITSHARIAPSGRFDLHDIEPHEASLCQRLTKEVEDCDSASNTALQSTPTAPLHSSLARVLRSAATAVQYHAKWFAPTALERLLVAVFEAASRSSSTTDLYAALYLVDTIGTYSLLPSLPSTLRFITFSYYQGSRSNRHRRLSQQSWTSAQQILEAHLGGQFPETILEIIRDSSGFYTRYGFGAIVGALMLTTERFLPIIDTQSFTIWPDQVLMSLTAVPIEKDGILREQVANLLGNMLQQESVASKIDGLSLWLELIRRCVSLSLDKDVVDSVFQSLGQKMSLFEPLHHPTIAQLFVEAHRPLPAELSSQLMMPWRRSLMLEDHAIWDQGYQDLLGKLCNSTLYTVELEAFIDISVLAYFQTESSGLRQQYIDTLASLLRNLDAEPAVVDILAKGIVSIFTHKTHKEKWEAQRNRTFPILCELASRSVVATRLLLRIRVDAAGVGYLELENAVNADVQDTARRQPQSNVYGLDTLSMGAWVSAVHDMIVRAPKRWDVYHTILTDLAPQLRNHALWRTKTQHINNLRESICELLSADSFVEPPPETGLKKSYIVAQFVQMLVATTSYHQHLPRRDIKSAVITIINVAGSRDHTVSIHCIHALTICCYELPELMAGLMDSIINKMARMVTQRYLAIYVLEFFAGLSRFPDLQNRLRREDFKRIFGVCHSYLQSMRSTMALERKRTPTSEHSAGGNSTSGDDLGQYVYALAHHVITFWYMALKRHDRHGLKEFITSCLSYTDSDGKAQIENQGLVTIDLMDRVDAEELITAPLTEYFDENDGRTITCHRVTGILLITTETSLRTGKTIVTIRRPSGTAQRLIASQPSLDPNDTSDMEDLEARITTSVTVETDMQDFINVFPDDITGRTYGKVAIPRPSSALGSLQIITLPENDAAVTRAIQAFDRTSALDSHKAGVIFVGEMQTTEDEILLNISGTPDYREFLEDIGTLRKLQGASFNTQGLDRAEDADGEYTMVWNNEVTELVYHITTFMPNDADTRLAVINKKRHIGNDFVNIVFNNSGAAFAFDTFPSAFNYVYITISPAERTSFLQAREATAAKKDRFYNVHVLTRPGFPSLSSAGEVKVVSGDSLGGYVRNLALNACMFSAMWHGDAPGEYPSSWRQRLEMIRRLYSKYKL
ncbi:unnamed protein product [Zymoseptoria tritici ST99CH_1E4]|nr:unnamed protein product [Zymoseptoria tritici ST99CH_1E4]